MNNYNISNINFDVERKTRKNQYYTYTLKLHIRENNIIVK